jgi:hypothetical protein
LAKRIKDTEPEWSVAVLYEVSVKRAEEVKLGVMWRLADMQKLSIKNSGRNSVWEWQSPSSRAACDWKNRTNSV